MVDWILDRVDGVEEIDEVHLVTNSRFARDFEEWAMVKDGVTVHDDGTSSNEDRLGRSATSPSRSTGRRSTTT